MFLTCVISKKDFFESLQITYNPEEILKSQFVTSSWGATRKKPGVGIKLFG